MNGKPSSIGMIVNVFNPNHVQSLCQYANHLTTFSVIFFSVYIHDILILLGEIPINQNNSICPGLDREVAHLGVPGDVTFCFSSQLWLADLCLLGRGHGGLFWAGWSGRDSGVALWQRCLEKGSGGAVPNSKLSQLTLKIFNKGPNPSPPWNYYAHWRSSIRDQILHPRGTITLIEDLQKGTKSFTPLELLGSLKIFNKGPNPSPPWNYYAHWRSSIRDQILHPRGTITLIEDLQ